MTTEIKVSISGKELASYTLEAGKSYAVGSGDAADIKLDAAVVAPHHAEITQLKRGKWMIVSLDDAYLQVKGKRVHQASLTSGLEIKIGPFSLSRTDRAMPLKLNPIKLITNLDSKKRMALLASVLALFVLFNLFSTGEDRDDSSEKVTEAELSPELNKGQGVVSQKNLAADKPQYSAESASLSKPVDAEGTGQDASAQSPVKQDDVSSSSGNQAVNKATGETLRIKRLREKYLSWADGFVQKGNHREAVIRLNAGLEKIEHDPQLLAVLIQAKAAYVEQLLQQQDYSGALQALSGRGMDSAVLKKLNAQVQHQLEASKRQQQQLARRKETLERSVFVIEKNYLTNEIEVGQALLDEVLADEQLEEMPGLREKILSLAIKYKHKNEELEAESSLLSAQRNDKKQQVKSSYGQCLKLRRENQYKAADTACRKVLKLTDTGSPERKEIRLWLQLLAKKIKEQDYQLMKEAEQCETRKQWKCAVQKLQAVKQLETDNAEVDVRLETILIQLRERAQAVYQDGLSYESVGNLSRASASWEQVIQLLPESEQYHQKAKSKLVSYR